MALLCLCILRPSLHYPAQKCEGCAHAASDHMAKRADGAAYSTACRAAVEPVKA